MHRYRVAALVAFVACALAGICTPARSDASPMGARDRAMPRYAHIFVIVEENKDYAQIIGSRHAPAINALAKKYGNATNYYAVAHPSEPNYVAMIGGSTFGIRDDDAYYCKPHDTRYCPGSDDAGFVDHTIDGPNLATQLQAAGLTWKDYDESIPKPGSLAVVAADPHALDVPHNLIVYASKHSGFINFASVQNDPRRAEHLVGFNQLASDLHDGSVPNFAFIIPNICNEMHGDGLLHFRPFDCWSANIPALIARGDRHAAAIVHEIVTSPVWKADSNSAIVITFDEDGHDGKQGGGGHIPTVVITNHGPRGVSDATPYSHYALLRTIEDAFGIHTYLNHAADEGVQPMLPLFAVHAP
ncbi:MAG: alkaline phosphatase family protein [Vulcanimicrobiaceae bacterium]